MTNKVLWNFEIQTYHQISTKQPDPMTVNSKKKKKKKRTLLNNALCRTGSPQIKKKKESKKTLLENKNKNKKLWNMKVTVIPIGIGALGTIPKSYVKGLEELEIRGQVKTIQPIGSIKIGQNTEKSPADSKRFAVTQTSVENHQLMLEWDTLNKIIMPSHQATEWKIKKETRNKYLDLTGDMRKLWKIGSRWYQI